MAKTTFGEQLERFMHERGLSVKDLMRRFYDQNAHNDTQIRRWLEIGREKPDEKKRHIEDDSLQLLADALELSYADSMYLHGLAGKVPPMRLPSLQQVVQELEQIIPAFENFPYPAYVLDVLRFRFWIINGATNHLLKLIGKTPAELANCSVFHFAFSERYGIAPLLGDQLKQTQREQIRRFKALNSFRRHEPFYTSYPECLKEGLSDDEYAAFENLWHSVTSDSKTVDNYAEASLIPMSFTVGPINFHLTSEYVILLNNLFSISRFNPRSPEDKAAADAIFGSAVSRECVKMWELPDCSHPDFTAQESAPLPAPRAAGRMGKRPHLKNGADRGG